MKTIATDLDGTLFKGETLIDGVRESILEIRRNDIEIYFTTNNSSQSPLEIRDKLVSLLDLEIDVDKIITPLIVFKNVISQKINNIYIYGTEGLKNYIESLNIKIVDMDLSDVVLIGRKEINNDQEIKDIISHVQDGKKIYCLNKDLTYPTEFGEQPGNGAVVKIIEDELSINIESLGKSGKLYPSYFKKNGISEPKDLPRSTKTSKDKLRFARLLTASITVAALELPPPSPEPRGIFFSIFTE